MEFIFGWDTRGNKTERTPPIPQIDEKQLGPGQIHRDKDSSMALEASPHTTAIVDTKSRDKSLSKCLRLALSSYPEEFFSWFVDWACHTYVPKPKLSLCFQTSVLKVLGHTHFRLGLLEPHIRTVPTPCMGILHIPLSKIVQIRRTLQSTRGHPNSVGLPGLTRAV